MKIGAFTARLIILGGVFFIATSTHAAGDLSITEIMYDVPGPNTGRQWIELRNNASTPIDLTDKKMRLGDDGGEHLIKAADASSGVLASGGVAVIATNPQLFLSTTGYSGPLFKSAFSLTSSGTLSLLENGEVLDSVSYSSNLGAKGDGNSLQYTNGVFKPAAPTPGLVPSILPAALIPAPKLSKTTHGSSIRTGKGKKSSSTSSKRSSTKKRTSKASKSYGKSITAPAASANAVTAGAPYMPSMPHLSFPTALLPYIPLLTSAWFAVFLGLLAFSSFSLIVLRKYDASLPSA